MFYAHIVLAKKGPLAKIWLAAHWDKRLTKTHVFETDIEQSIDGILQPKVKMALRTTGHLLLGVVRIYSRKAKYLLADCNEAFIKMKMAFRTGTVDLPEEHREAPLNAITLPEVFHDFDTALPELTDINFEAPFSNNQYRSEEITLREEYGSMPMPSYEEGFGEMSPREFVPDEVEDDDMGDNMFDDFFLDEPDDFDIRTSHQPAPEVSEIKEASAGLFGEDIFEQTPVVEPPPVEKPVIEQPPVEIPQPAEPVDPAEAQSFVLAPIDITSAQVAPTRMKRKRKLIVDEVKSLSAEDIKNQLTYTSDIVTTLSIAPPTRKLMLWKDIGVAEKLFNLPGREFWAVALIKNYQRNLITDINGIENISNMGPLDVVLAEDELGPIVKRRRKLAKDGFTSPLPDSAPHTDFMQQPENIPLVGYPQTPAFTPQNEYIPQHEFMNEPEAIRDERSFDPSLGLIPNTSIPVTTNHSVMAPNQFIDPTMPSIHMDQSISPVPLSDHDFPQQEPDILQDLVSEFVEEQMGEELKEQQEDETTEEFEERVLNKRAGQLFKAIRGTLLKKGSLSLNELTMRNHKKQAAQKFYSLLVLKKFQILNLEQSEPYSNIIITKGSDCDSHKL